MIAPLDRVREAYATCRSYKDAGTVTANLVLSESHRFTCVSNYAIDFVRENHLRIEFLSQEPNRPFVSNLKLTYDQTSVFLTQFGTPREHPDLSSAIASTAGITYGMTLLWARLLLPNSVSGYCEPVDGELWKWNCNLQNDSDKSIMLCTASGENLEMSIRVRDSTLILYRHLLTHEDLEFDDQPFGLDHSTDKRSIIIEASGDPIIGMCIGDSHPGG